MTGAKRESGADVRSATAPCTRLSLAHLLPERAHGCCRLLPKLAMASCLASQNHLLRRNIVDIPRYNVFSLEPRCLVRAACPYLDAAGASVLRACMLYSGAWHNVGRHRSLLSPDIIPLLYPQRSRHVVCLYAASSDPPTAGCSCSAQQFCTITRELNDVSVLMLPVLCCFLWRLWPLSQNVRRQHHFAGQEDGWRGRYQRLKLYGLIARLAKHAAYLLRSPGNAALSAAALRHAYLSQTAS